VKAQGAQPSREAEQPEHALSDELTRLRRFGYLRGVARCLQRQRSAGTWVGSPRLRNSTSVVQALPGLA
jgi:hypothetical protein